MTITNINHITLAVTDIHRSFSFYKDVLAFKPLVKWDQGAYFLIGDFWFCLNVDLEREPPVLLYPFKKANPGNWKNVEWFV